MKKVIIEPEKAETVLLSKTDDDKIYVSAPHSGFYKLHQIGGNWMFCELSSSWCGSTGVHACMKKAIEAEIGAGDVYELNSVAELVEFLQGKK